MRRVLALMLVAGCFRGSAPASSPAEAHDSAASSAPPLSVVTTSEPGCPAVVHLRAARAPAVAEILRRHGLVITELSAVVIPPQGTASDVVRTVTVGGRSLTGIIESYSGTCVRSWRGFALDQRGNVWKLEPPSGVVDYKESRCLTDHGWVPCDLTGTTDVLYVLPQGKTFAGIVNPESGLRIELPPAP
ncbi:MAG: hypothetical protein IPQ07_40605 [Myxococcales bacterium]|nr:hypothetical protein [Myxococcales bacterium]